MKIVQILKIPKVNEPETPFSIYWRDNFFSYKHFGSPTRGEMAQIVYGSRHFVEYVTCARGDSCYNSQLHINAP